jgi:hypothetical protein
MGRQIADRETDPAMRAVVRLRSVDQPDVMQGHLALGQDHIDRLAFVHLDLDLLPPGQHVLLGEGVAMGSWSIRWLPGTTRMQPLSTVLGVRATQAVTISAPIGPNKSNPDAR